MVDKAFGYDDLPKKLQQEVKKITELKYGNGSKKNLELVMNELKITWLTEVGEYKITVKENDVNFKKHILGLFAIFTSLTIVIFMLVKITYFSISDIFIPSLIIGAGFGAIYGIKLRSKILIGFSRILKNQI